MFKFKNRSVHLCARSVQIYAAVILALGIPNYSLSQTASPETINRERDSIAFLKVTYTGPNSENCKSSQGSGFFISEVGHALTAAHVLKKSSNCPDEAIQVVTGRVGYSRTGAWIPVDVLEDNILQSRDVALVRFAERRENYRAMALCWQGEPDRNNYVGLGFPEGRNYGNVQLRFQNTEQEEWIFASHQIPGMSGGPMIDEEGRAIGIIRGSQSRRSDLSTIVVPLRMVAVLTVQAIPELSDCDMPDEPERQVQVVDGWSDWRKGGYNRSAWCSDMRRGFESSIGQKRVEWTVLETKEERREEFFRQFFYRYYCRAEAKWP